MCEICHNQNNCLAMSVKILKRIFSVILVASAAVVFGANPFRTYRNSNTDSQDLGMQIISKVVTPFSFEISLGGTQLTASSVKAELLNKIDMVTQLKDDPAIQEFADEAAAFAVDSDSYHASRLVKTVKCSGHAHVTAFVLMAEKLTSGVLHLQMRGADATANVSLRRKLTHHHEKRKWKGKWRTTRWETYSEEDRGIKPDEVVHLHNVLEEEIKKHQALLPRGEL